MASFVGRESLTPAAVKKQKRASSAPHKGTDFSSETDGTSGSVSSPPLKKKKKKSQSSDDDKVTLALLGAPKIVNNAFGSPPSGPENESEEKTPSSGKWDKEDVAKLFARIQEALPAKDERKCSTMVEKLAWDGIGFEGYSGDDCRKQWLELSSKVRHYKTMTEVLESSKHLYDNPDKNAQSKKHPDMPKRPKSGFLRFFLKRRVDISKEHPDLGLMEVTKLIGKQYKELPNKKKKKFHDAYLADVEVFKVQYEEFLLKHPEFRPEGKAKSKKKSSGEAKAKAEPKIKAPDRPLTAMQIYVKHKVDEHLERTPTDNKVDTIKLYQRKFGEMKESKKMKYINKALVMFSDYKTKVKTFMEEHPDIEVKPFDHILTIPESKIKDASLKRPEKPATNVYAHFTRLMLKHSDLVPYPKNQRMVEVSKRWKALTDAEKKNFSNELAMLRATYDDDYVSWKAGLNDQERERIEAEETAVADKMAAKLVSKAEASKTPKKPLSAMFEFIKEKREQYRKSYPGKSDTDITRMLSRAFQELPEKKKQKYVEQTRGGGVKPVKNSSVTTEEESDSDSSSSGSDSGSGSDSDDSSSSDSASEEEQKQTTPAKPKAAVYSSSSDSDSD